MWHDFHPVKMNMSRNHKVILAACNKAIYAQETRQENFQVEEQAVRRSVMMKHCVGRNQSDILTVKCVVRYRKVSLFLLDHCSLTF